MKRRNRQAGNSGLRSVHKLSSPNTSTHTHTPGQAVLKTSKPRAGARNHNDTNTNRPTCSHGCELQCVVGDARAGKQSATVLSVATQCMTWVQQSLYSRLRVPTHDLDADLLCTTCTANNSAQVSIQTYIHIQTHSPRASKTSAAPAMCVCMCTACTQTSQVATQSNTTHAMLGTR